MLITAATWTATHLITIDDMHLLTGAYCSGISDCCLRYPEQPAYTTYAEFTAAGGTARQLRY